MTHFFLSSFHIWNRRPNTCCRYLFIFFSCSLFWGANNYRQQQRWIFWIQTYESCDAASDVWQPINSRFTGELVPFSENPLRVFCIKEQSGGGGGGGGVVLEKEKNKSDKNLLWNIPFADKIRTVSAERSTPTFTLQPPPPPRPPFKFICHLWSSAPDQQSLSAWGDGGG